MLLFVQFTHIWIHNDGNITLTYYSVLGVVLELLVSPHKLPWLHQLLHGVWCTAGCVSWCLHGSRNIYTDLTTTDNQGEYLQIYFQENITKYDFR